MNLFLMTAYAEPVAAGTDGNALMASFGSLLIPILMLAFLYFIMIRPQRKKDKLTKEMLAGLVVGDKIVTIGGIHGKITQIKDDNLIIETGSATEKSSMKICRWAVREVVKPAEA